MLRLRGLDAVPPVSLPRAGAGAAADADAAPAARRTGAAHAGRAGPGRVRHLQLHGRGGRGAVRRHAGRAAAEQPDRRRPGPVAPDAGRDAGAGGEAQRRARLAGRGAVREWGRHSPSRRADGQRLVAAGLRAGNTPRHWAVAGATGGCDGRQGRSVGGAGGARRADGGADGVCRGAPGFYHPGRSGVVRQGPKTVLGRFGELHPRVLAALDLAGPVVAFELNLDAVPEPKRAAAAAPDLPPFQPVRRDFAFLVDAGVTADAVLRAARGAERTLIAGVSLFDVYAGRQAAGGQEVAGDRGGVPAARTHADRRRDRGGLPEGRCGGGEGDRRDAALAEVAGADLTPIFGRSRASRTVRPPFVAVRSGLRNWVKCKYMPAAIWVVEMIGKARCSILPNLVRAFSP